MLYQSYLDNRFSSGSVEQIDFTRYEAYATQAIEYLIDTIVPYWVKGSYPQSVNMAIEDATVQQIEYLNNGALKRIESGVIRKRESMEGYSIEFDIITIGGMQIASTAYQCLHDAFMKAGLMNRVVQ